ncbi:unnamed protein product [Lupinus luteus]|uniref:Trichome birefringence-like N-terminal domain-containing protein n=1 Tax=Lupinus luteus TaxID=3873 RepID=A0AAV1YKZ3_LUPLU
MKFEVPKGVFLLPLTLLVIVFLLPQIRNLNQSSSYKIYSSISEFITTPKVRCNIYSGNWTLYYESPYYNNETCHFMYHKHNCLKHGRPDREILKLRWKPDECELPLFDADQFLKLVRGKSMAFVGDSIGRNQMESLKNMTELDLYGYRNAFRTALRTIANLKGFKGLTYLVTHSPNHYENGEWYEGGTCDRTKPFTKEERHEYKREGLLKSLYDIQVEELTSVEKEARKNGLHFGLIDITELMTIRVDGHPSRYGSMVDNDKSIKDCVHWCISGPVDTWNKFLLYMMKLDGEN